MTGAGTAHDHDHLGAHLIEQDGVSGVRFAVWAPNARHVAVIADFNGWDGGRHVMRRSDEAGVWTIFIPGVAAGEAYQYRIVGGDGEVRPLKADPVAVAAAPRPARRPRRS